MNKRALITGISGQDGSYLAEYLLSLGYEVHGIIRANSTDTYPNIEHIRNKLYLHYGDISYYDRVYDIINEVLPYELYHLGAQSDVAQSFKEPSYTHQVNTIGTANILNAIRYIKPDCKIYNAATSELYGQGKYLIQNENTPFNPVSPYAIAKYNAYMMCNRYKDTYNMFICSGILFNHECARRGKKFVTTKIINGLKNAIENNAPLALGNIYSSRDWGLAPIYIKAMHLMLQSDKPDNYVIASGETHTIKEFIEEYLKYAYPNLKTYWEGSDILEHLYTEDKKLLIYIDPNLYRPNEVPYLKGDAYKAKNILGWNYNITFSDFVKQLIKDFNNEKADN